MRLGKTALFHKAVFFCALLSPSVPGQTEETGAKTASGAATADPVTFVFYNLRNYLAMDRRVSGKVIENAPKPDGEVKALLEGLVAIRPDILSVCELGDTAHLEDLRSRLKAAGIDLPHTEIVKDAAGWNRNLALLSRFPIVGRRSRDDYTYELAGNRHAFQRGILDVSLAINSHYHLRCIGLHLKSKREVPEGNEALMRLNEARLAREHIDRILEEDPRTNLLVAGDLNAVRIEPPLKTLQGGFGSPGYLKPLSLRDGEGFTWTHYWSLADVYSRFDYALYSDGLNGEFNRDLCRIHHWENWEKASDHRPIVISLIPIDK